MNKKATGLKILSYVLGLLLVVSVFKNISYPLLWGDESMTAMCSQRVLQYGYPKAHDGKNVLNDMYCNTPEIAINPKDDAFIGGANWGQYYFGVIGYLLAADCNNIYTKTGVYRSTFAIVGLLGLFLFAFSMSKFFADKFYKYLFLSLFFVAELISISLTLHLREVRYYSPTLFLSSSIISLYVLYRFHKPFNKIIYSIALAVLLWLLFNVFSPLYFVFILAIALSETVISIFQYAKTKKLKVIDPPAGGRTKVSERSRTKEAIMPCLPAFAAIIISFAGVYPLLIYFKTFEIKRLLDNFYHFNATLYWQNLSLEFNYFSKEELLWLALAMRIAVLRNFKKALKVKSLPGRQTGNLFRVSNFLSLLFVIFFFSIPDIDSAFTRYFIYMQPVVSVIAIFDFIFLIKLFSVSPGKFWNTIVETQNIASLLFAAVFTALFGFTFAGNLPFITGHIYEMTHQYKGPLDYTIPYIQAHYPRTDTLIIAANCGETPYMYYLNSKVIVGYIGNNMPEDTLFQPDIIAYRQSVGSSFKDVFKRYLKKAVYSRVFFPARDIPVNNIPELNHHLPAYNHYFKSLTTDYKYDEVNLLLKK